MGMFGAGRQGNGRREEVIINTTHFRDRVAGIRSAPLTADDIVILQVNLGYACNMACRHCHVEAMPGRDQMMNGDTVETVIRVLKDNGIETLDITGGAPEMNPHFVHLVEEVKKAGHHVMVRTNLTILFEEGMESLPEFFSDNSVEVIASLPYYAVHDVDRVRGEGTFEKCVEALRRLNSLGYGKGVTDKRLNLVYNPAGPFLSPLQRTLEDDYRRELGRRFGISFDKLYTFTNVPIGRFRDHLVRTRTLDKYMEKLVLAFNPETLEGLMCRHLINVGWDGTLYDCDFNQMLGLSLQSDCPQHCRDFDYSRLTGRTITVGNHCYACAAGQGST